MVDIKILGSGCKKCKELYNNVIEACNELKIESTVLKVEDYEKIAEYNVLSTPALVVNGIVVGSGKISKSMIKELLSNAR